MAVSILTSDTSAMAVSGVTGDTSAMAVSAVTEDQMSTDTRGKRIMSTARVAGPLHQRRATTLVHMETPFRDGWMRCCVAIPAARAPTAADSIVITMFESDTTPLVLPLAAVRGTKLRADARRSRALTVLPTEGTTPLAQLRAATVADLMAVSDGIFDAVQRYRRTVVFEAAVDTIRRDDLLSR
jgi:hypothetical protein